MEDLQKYDSTKEYVKNAGIFIEWAHENRRLIAYPCSDSKVYNLCAFVPSREIEIDTQADGKCHVPTRIILHITNLTIPGWQTVGEKETIVELFSQFSPGVRKIIDKADAKLKVWELFDMEELPTWVSGHAALIGDSAHPFQPCRF